MRKTLALFVLLYFATLNALAFNPLGFTQYAAIPATNTAVNLHGVFRSITIWSDPAAADLYIELHGAAATVGGATCIHLPPGAGYQTPAGCNLGISTFNVIGSSATGNYTTTAF